MEATDKEIVLPVPLCKIIGSSEEVYKLLYESTERLYIGGYDFVGSIAEKLRFPDWMDNERAGCVQTLGYYWGAFKPREKKLPLNAAIAFYRRPSDGQIAAIAYCCSLLHLEQEFMTRVVDLFPRVKADKANNLFRKREFKADYEQWLLKGVVIGA